MNTLCAQRNNSRGFTLVELMVVVAVIGILSAIAIPAYSDYVRRATVADMVSSMSDAKLRVEQRYADNRSYASALCASPAVTITTGTNFVVRCITSDAAFQTYTITGTGSGPIAGFVYTVNEAGAKASTVGSVWGGVAVAGRWIMKKGE